MARADLTTLLAAGILTLTLGACSSTVATRGNMLDAQQLSTLQPGVTTRDDVAASLGTPTATATFDQSTWYYIGQRTEKTAFFMPTVVARKVVAVHFDDKGVVAKVDALGLEDGQTIAMVDRQTPTAGKELTVMEQMLGNLGRFNPAPRTPSRGTGGGR